MSDTTEPTAQDLRDLRRCVEKWAMSLSDEQLAKWNVRAAQERVAEDPIVARNALLRRMDDAEQAGRWSFAETLFVADSDAFEVCHDGVFWADGWNARRLREATTVRRTR